MRKYLPTLWLLPFFLMLFAFQWLPLGWIMKDSVISGTTGALSLDNFKQIFTSSYYLTSISNATEISLYSAFIGLLIAIIISHAMYVSRPTSRFMVGFLNMISNFAGVPLAFAFIIILGLNGIITVLLKNWGLGEFQLYSQLGLSLVYVYFQLPLAVLLLYPSFDALRPEWQEASAILGAKKWQFWWHVGLPVLRNPIITTFVILYANAVGSYATAFALIGNNYNLLTIRITALVAGDLFPHPHLAAALSLTLVANILIVALIGRLIMRSRHAKK